jgi:class 3 adenylate cyclase
MPASANFQVVPALEVSPLLHGALYTAATLTVSAGFIVVPITISQQYFRLPRPQPGNLLARARTLNSSSVFVCTSAEVEDPMGRQVGHGVAQWAVRAVDPPPPAAPATIEPVEEPTYSTPDPPDRAPVGAPIPAELFGQQNGLEIATMMVGGQLPPFPLQHLMGARWVDASDGASRWVMPASEWFCLSSNEVSEAALGVLLDFAVSTAGMTLLARGQSAAGLDNTHRFLRRVLADGRELSAQGYLRQRAGDVVYIEAELFDPDGLLVATATSAWAIGGQRARRTVEPERVLATLLFTDIVGSTERAQRLGDASWRALLGEHDALVRRELGAHRGRETNTTGDGFLARFESPAGAVRCARAIRDGVRQLGLEIRAGVHTGECEVKGSDLAGIALHVAARIVAVAEPSEIIVSQTVKDLATGSGLRFAPRGSHALKGVEGEWTLFAVEEP